MHPSRKDAPRFQSKMVPLSAPEDGEPLKRFIDLAHERDIMIMAYHQLARHYMAPAFNEFKTEWHQLYIQDSRTGPEQPGDRSFCYNSPYRDWLPEYLKEFIEHLDVDGFYFDGTNWGSHHSYPYYTGCRCDFCAERFKKELGLDIPVRADFDSDTWRRFLLWRFDTLRDFMAHITTRIHETYPDAILEFGILPFAHNSWGVGHPPNPLGLEAAGGRFFMEMSPHEIPGLLAKYGRANGTPSRIFIQTTQWLKEVHTMLAPYPDQPVPFLRCFSALANASPLVFAMLHAPSHLIEDFMGTGFAEVKRRVPYMDGETVKYTALHFSQQARDFWNPPPVLCSSSEEWEDPIPPGYRPATFLFEGGKEYQERIDGTYELLDQSHLLSDILFDEQLTAEYLAPYRVLVLSNSACLSDEQCEVIRGFVRDGGTLMATHETSLQDGLGHKRDDFGLADVFGVNYKGPVTDGEVCGVIYVPQKPEMDSIPELVICTEALDSEITPKEGCELTVPATRCSLAGDQPLDYFDPRKEYDSGKAAVVEHAFGKGKAIYISADVGKGFTGTPYPPLRRFMAALAGRTESPIDVEAPVVIKVTAATRPNGELMVHLLNYPVPYYAHDFKGPPSEFISNYVMNPEEVNPVRDIRNTQNDCKPKRAHMPLRDMELEITGDPATVIVPEVHLHEVIVLEI